MAVNRDNTKEIEALKRVKEQAAVYEKDKSLLAAEVTDDMRKKVDFAGLRKKLESAKQNGLSKEWYVRLDKSIQNLEVWFNINK